VRESLEGIDVRFEVYAGSGGKCRWRLLADNGQNVASSGESFASKSNADPGSRRVQG
jgi:uncharacterized protein YegP (UPF0339 family)